MSQAVFPTFPGLKWGSKKTPYWKNRVQEAVSGKEKRAAYWTYPRYKLDLSYEVLRAGAEAELQQLLGFFNARKGNFDSFLVSDPDDNAVTAQAFGTGDGARTEFQLLRSYGGFIEPVFDVTGAPAIYKSDWQGNQLQYSTARTNLIARSEELNDAAWSYTDVTVTPNATISPDGSTTAELLTATGPDSHGFQVITMGALQPIKTSVWLRAAVPVNFSLVVRQQPSVTDVVAYVDVTTSWQRFEFSFTTVAGTTSLQFFIGGYGGFVSGEEVYAWGAQVEISAILTPYIKTGASPVTVTDYTLSPSGLVTFAVPPLNAAALTWTGSYYWRCRFVREQQEFEQFMRQLWQAQRVELVTTK